MQPEQPSIGEKDKKMTPEIEHREQVEPVKIVAERGKAHPLKWRGRGGSASVPPPTPGFRESEPEEPKSFSKVHDEVRQAYRRGNLDQVNELRRERRDILQGMINRDEIDGEMIERQLRETLHNANADTIRADLNNLENNLMNETPSEGWGVIDATIAGVRNYNAWVQDRRSQPDFVTATANGDARTLRTINVQIENYYLAEFFFPVPQQEIEEAFNRPAPEAPEHEEPEPPPDVNRLADRMEAAGVDLDMIQDDRLIGLIRRVGRTPDVALTADLLREEYLNLNKLQRDSLDPRNRIDAFDDSELTAVLGPLGQWLAELDRAERRGGGGARGGERGGDRPPAGPDVPAPRAELPRNPEQQRNVIRIILNRMELRAVESYHVQNTEDNNTLTYYLGNPELNIDVKAEMTARLRLNDSYLAVRKALKNGSDDKVNKIPGGLFKSAQAELNERKRLLEGSDFAVILQGGMPGLQVGRAFNLLQEAAQAGRIFNKNVSQVDEEAEYTTIAGLVGGDPQAATKAVQLATNMAWATLEVTVWNDDLAGTDAVAEIIFLQKYRNGEGLNKDRGPEITIDMIEGVGSSFFRMAMLAVPEGQPPRRLTNTTRTLRRGHDEDRLDVTNPAVMDFRGLANEAYGTYLASTVPKMLRCKEMLLKTDWTPDDVGRDQVESWDSAFNSAIGRNSEIIDAVNPRNPLNLRSVFILGLFDASTRDKTRGGGLGWSGVKINQAEKALLESIKRKDPRKPNEQLSFLVMQEMKEIERRINLGIRKYTINPFASDEGPKRKK